MGYDIDIRFRCRSHFEIYDKSLSDISKLESVPVSTLSDWKNDDREEFGGLWIKGSRKDEIGKVAKMLQDEIIETQTYKNLKENLKKRHGVKTNGQLEMGSMISLDTTNEEIRAKIEAEALMIGALGIDFFNNALVSNAVLSQTVLNHQVQQDVTKVKQADIKASSEIIKIAKEAKFGKDPDTINQFTFQVGKLDYTDEEIKDMGVDELDKLAKALEEKILKEGIIDAELLEHSKNIEEE